MAFADELKAAGLIGQTVTVDGDVREIEVVRLGGFPVTMTTWARDLPLSAYISKDSGYKQPDKKMNSQQIAKRVRKRRRSPDVAPEPLFACCAEDTSGHRFFPSGGQFDCRREHFVSHSDIFTIRIRKCNTKHNLK